MLEPFGRSGCNRNEMCMIHSFWIFMLSPIFLGFVLSLSCLLFFLGFFLLVKFILYVTLYTDFSVLLETF